MPSEYTLLGEFSIYVYGDIPIVLSVVLVDLMRGYVLKSRILTLI